jgi:formate-dependent nitrite reductase membrane component NrfD
MGHHISWELPVAVDLFLAGLGAGAFLLAVAVDFAGGRKYQTVSTVGAFVAPWPAIAGVLLLVVDLGQPLRFWEMVLRRDGGGALWLESPLIMFNAGSVMSWGTWVLSIFIVLSLCYIGAALAAYPFPWGGIIKKLVGLAGVPFALMVMVYTGVLLSATSSGLWATYFLPVLFVASAMVSGVASVVLVLAVLRWLGIVQEESYIPQLEKLNSRIMVFQLIALVVFMIAVAGSGMLGAVVGSPFGPIWWVGVVILGLLLPMLYGFKGKLRTPQGSLVMAGLVLIGGFFLRYVILMAGQGVGA